MLDSKVLVEQYKIYIQTILDITRRRQQANQFFLSLNMAIITLMGAVWATEGMWALILIICALGSILSFIWFKSMRAYKMMNFYKYQILKNLEKDLPADLFQKEWSLMEEAIEGKKTSSSFNSSVYVELKIPVLFSAFFAIVVIVQTSYLLLGI